MSIRRPQNIPIYIPSFLPRIKLKEERRIMSKLGAIPAKDANWKNVVCNTKHIVIKINKTIFLSIPLSCYCSEVSEVCVFYALFCALVCSAKFSVPVSLIFVITNTSSRCAKSTTGVIVPLFVKLLALSSILEI